jgi:enamine deaminase RidA (YjgF/YER057c/UK114 family)
MISEVLKTTIIEQVIQAIFPISGTTVEEQVISCHNQVTTYLQESGCQKWQIVKLAYFVDCNNNIEKKEIDSIVSYHYATYFNSFVPYSIIPEKPLNDYKIALEITLMPSIELDQLEVKRIENIKYLTIKSLQGKYVIASGMGQLLPVSDIHMQGIIAFEQAEKILKNENLNFNNIVRQWNYIEKIVDYTESNQHYQIFNDIRSSFYKKTNFENGYPSATGIGIACSGVIINFIALVPTSDFKILPIKSPVQADAHNYTNQVLADNTQDLETTKTTPKFERAKAILNTGQGTIFVSGTAAIKGELSAKQFDIKQQTILTLNNIDQLIGQENLEQLRIQSSQVTKLQYFRVYIKHRTDFKIVDSIIKERIGNTPYIILEADICRPELLVEIEGLYLLQNK